MIVDYHMHLRRAGNESDAIELTDHSLPAVERYVEAGTSTQYSIAASIALWCVLFGVARLFFMLRRSAVADR